MTPMRSISHRKTIQKNHSLLPKRQLNFPFRHYDLTSEILGVFGIAGVMAGSEQGQNKVSALLDGLGLK